MSERGISLKRSSGEDDIEPEMVSPGPESHESRGEGARPDRRGNYPSFFLKVKLVLTAAALLAGFGLMVLGAILTSTLIGAVLGVPLILLGVCLLRLLFAQIRNAGNKGLSR